MSMPGCGTRAPPRPAIGSPGPGRRQAWLVAGGRTPAPLDRATVVGERPREVLPSSTRRPPVRACRWLEGSETPPRCSPPRRTRRGAPMPRIARSSLGDSLAHRQPLHRELAQLVGADLGVAGERELVLVEEQDPARDLVGGNPTPQEVAHVVLVDGRSEERRVGKECRSRWSPYH